MKNPTKLCFIIVLAALLVTACGQTNQPSKVSYSLKTALQDGKMVFVGTGGDIDRQVNPTLKADVGDIVTIKLTSGDGAEQNISLPDFNVNSSDVAGQGKSTSVTFGVDKAGAFAYLSVRGPGVN